GRRAPADGDGQRGTAPLRGTGRTQGARIVRDAGAGRRPRVESGAGDITTGEKRCSHVVGVQAVRAGGAAPGQGGPRGGEAPQEGQGGRAGRHRGAEDRQHVLGQGVV